jgi:hypothetical protein
MPAAGTAAKTGFSWINSDRLINYSNLRLAKYYCGTSTAALNTTATCQLSAVVPN